MGTPRKKDLIKSRRRVADDGEEEGSVVAGVEDDSLSEGSAISDGDEDADGEGSDGSDTGSLAQQISMSSLVANGHRGALNNVQRPQSSPTTLALRGVTQDTEAMMNGLRITGGVEDEEVHFDELEVQDESQPAENLLQREESAQPVDTLGERRRREHEEYKKRRDANPAFVPNRGGFFMHDHRAAAPGQNGYRPFGRGRGRGRGGLGGPVMAPSFIPPQGADAPWAHDLHETVTQPNPHAPTGQSSKLGLQEKQKPIIPSAREQPPNRSFSSTTRIADVKVRVLIRGMAEPIIFSAVPVNQHTRLPHHRPPLRRDKPVRISLPEMPIRYIFPSTDRSFIFIPRALRPNQQGFGRIRGRGSFGGGYSVFGPLSSRRTSVYAGSTYSPSIAMSRRSSLAREVAAEAVVPPAGSSLPRVLGMAAEAGKPVVRLPPPAEQEQALGEQPAPVAAPTVNLPQSSAYPLPQNPTFRENRPAALPMHHPKPERTLQVADIESPATLEFNPPQQQQQQPFHQQVPMQYNGPAYPDPSQYPHSRHPSHPSQASGGTPLAQIPERAIHAQPFQPHPYQYPQPFYPQQYPPQVYYYPPTDPSGAAPSAAAPPFVPGQQYPYPMPVAPAPPASTEPTTQPGTVAHESGGMVFYYDSSQLAAAGGENQPPYTPPAYGVPGGVVGMGGMMTPPVQFFPPPPMYYPPP